jgi:hypothetical protein
MVVGDDCGALGGMIDKGNRYTLREPCPRVALSTTDPKLLESGSKPDRFGGKLLNNSLSYGTVHSAFTVKKKYKRII